MPAAPEITGLRTATTKRFFLGKNKVQKDVWKMEAHVGHIHYFNKLGAGDGERRWREIDWTLSFDELRRGWSFQFHSFQPFLPEYADEWVEFRDLYEEKDQTTRFKAVCAHVKGVLIQPQELAQHGLSKFTSVNAVIYPDAFGEGRDYILYFTRSGLTKIVRIRDGFKSAVDENFDWEVDMPRGSQVFRAKEKEDIGKPGRGSYQVDIEKDKAFDTDKRTLIGNADARGEQFTYFKSFLMWDDGSEEERSHTALCPAAFTGRQNKLVLRKTIPASFQNISIGNLYADTTTSFYPGAGDGKIESISSSSWADARTGGAVDFTAGPTATSGSLRNDNFGPGTFWYCYRGFLPFDTSAIGAGAEIASATLRLTSTGSETAGETIFDTHLVRTNQASTSTLTTADFAPVDFTSGGEITVANWTSGAGTDNTMTLNATGLSWINGAGNTLLGLVGEADQTNSSPSSYNADRSPNLYYSERTGTDDDPMLSVTYSLITSRFLQLFP